MKLWQKAAFLFIGVFLAGVVVISSVYLQKSRLLDEQIAMTVVKNEFDMIKASLDPRLSEVSNYYEEFNEENIKLFIDFYGDYYQAQKTYIQINSGNDCLYTSFSWPVQIESGGPFFILDGEHYVIYQGEITFPNQQPLMMTVLHNMEYIAAAEKSMIRFSVAANLIVTSLIALIGFVMFNRLTKPLRDFSVAADRIASGELQERVPISSDDEIGQFAASFNQMAESVERHMKEKDEMLTERQQFIDHLAHEIRTPITAIIGYSQVMLHVKATEADKQRAGEYIQEQSMRLKALSEKLLNLSRLQYDTVELHTVSVMQPIHSALRTLQMELNTKNIRLSLDESKCVIMGDITLLETLFQNIIENAIHASHYGGEIRIKVQQNQNSTAVRVEDNGIGIAEEHICKITEPFMRVDKARSRQHGGAGIGLALCAKICELHHAVLSVESEVGAGTAITIDFTNP